MRGATETRLGRFLHWLFEASLLVKGLFAAAETFSGLALFGLPGGVLLDWAQRLTARELTEDPKDAVANWLLQGAQHFSIQTQDFYGFYLTSHGALKLLVVLLLMRGILWAYPAAVLLLSGFVGYQLYLWNLDHAPSMLALTALDLFVIALTLREWHVRHGFSFRKPRP